MCVDAVIIVLLVDVALFAGDLFSWVDGVIVRNHATEDLVILGPVAISALKVQVAAHVNIFVLAWEVETLVKITVLDAVSAAAISYNFV